MAIAFDAAGQGGGTPVVTKTWTHTVGTLTDGIAIMIVMLDGTKTVSGTPTFGGNNMTLLFSWSTGEFFNNTYVYYYLNPSSGSNTVSITASASAYIYGVSGTYSGVDQTNPFGSTPTYTTNSADSVTSLTTSLTTTVDNAWLVGMGHGGNGGTAAGTNTTRRATSYANYNWHALLDTNAAQTPAGSFSMQHTGTTANRDMTMVQIIPTQAGGGYTFVPQLGRGVFASL